MSRRTDLSGFPALEHGQSAAGLPVGEHDAFLFEQSGRVVEHLVGLPGQLRLMPAERVALATAESASGSGLVSIAAGPT